MTDFDLQDIRCPVCSRRPKRTETKYGLRLDCCGLWAWGENPLVDRDTHEARKAAHTAFDPLWREGHVSRSKAYKRLADEMQMSREECHMKLMSVTQARMVPAIAAKLEREWKK